MTGFTHFDGGGNAVMVDVGGKEGSEREARAEGRICMGAECFAVLLGGGDFAKGDVLGVARIAGIMAVKQTPFIIPLCHPLMITKVSVDFSFDDVACEVVAYCTVKTNGVTGVEMEALTGVSAALLTIYDMCKSMDRGMSLHGIRLLEKSGGKSGTWRADDA